MNKFLLTISLLLACAPLARAEEETPAPTHHAEIIRIDEADADAELEALQKEGVNILYRRGDLLLAYVPYATPGEETPSQAKRKLPPSLLPGDTRPQKPFNPNVPTMLNASRLMDADKIRTGSEGISPLSGKGVVVGFCDIGFDARHINFLDPSGKVCRVKLAVQYIEDYGLRNVYDSPEKIYEWQTDTEDNFHATHVAGILAGGYSTQGYQGMAPEADIVATTSTLHDATILAGVEDVIAYAKSVGKPAVVNISIGSYLGPHDGTSLFCQYLDRCAEDAIICISAGNEGAANNHAYKNFTPSDNTLRVRFANNDWTNMKMYGATDFYSDSSQPFSVSLFVNDNSSFTRYLFDTGLIDPASLVDGNWILTSDPELTEPPYHYSEEFAKYFNGEIYLYASLDPENGRYHAQVFYDCQTETYVSEASKWARYRIGAAITGSPGQHVDAFADGSWSWFARAGSTFATPDNLMSVSDMATGHNVISVGMHCAQQSILKLDGSYYNGDEPYTIIANSGYGKLLDGRDLPLTVAPGSPIVSSFSTPYLTKHSAEGMASIKTLPDYSSYSPAAAPTLYDPQQYYYWLPYGGTSMSSPYVAGCIASWLQLKPDLSSSEAISLIASTNDSEAHPLSADPHNGQGYFRPYKALAELAKGLGTSVETTLGCSLFASRSGDTLIIANPDMREVYVNFYASDGRSFAALRAGNAPSMSIPLCDLPQGLVLCRISAPGAAPLSLKLRL